MRWAIGLASLLVAVTASARAPYRLPPGTRLQLPEGTYQGYTLEEMKVLLKMDVDLEAYEKEIPKYKQSLEDYAKVLEAKEAIIKSKDKQVNLLKEDMARLTTKWSEENKLRHECENKPKFGSWIAWTIAAVATVTAIALGVTIAVIKAK